MNHYEYSLKKFGSKEAISCSASHMTFGGLCLNCGFETLSVKCLSGEESAGGQMRIIAYTFSADVHCVHCTVKQFAGKGDATKGFKDANGIHKYQEDCEGNLIHPVFSTDESPSSHCGTCLKEIQK